MVQSLPDPTLHPHSRRQLQSNHRQARVVFDMLDWPEKREGRRGAMSMQSAVLLFTAWLHAIRCLGIDGTIAVAVYALDLERRRRMSMQSDVLLFSQWVFTITDVSLFTELLLVDQMYGYSAYHCTPVTQWQCGEKAWSSRSFKCVSFDGCSLCNSGLWMALWCKCCWSFGDC